LPELVGRLPLFHNRTPVHVYRKRLYELLSFLPTLIAMRLAQRRAPFYDHRRFAESSAHRALGFNFCRVARLVFSPQ
jgi:hypothetical protein